MSEVPEVNELGQPVGDLVVGWTPRPPAVAVALHGRSIDLEPLSVDHAAALHTALCDDASRSLWTYRPTDPPSTVAAMADLVAATLATPVCETFVLVPHGLGPQGLASYLRIDPMTGQVEVGGVLFSRRLQRTRAATEAIHVLMAHAFDTLGYRRFEWKCDSLNEPSRRAAVRLGFGYEGRFRHHMVTKGRNRDTDWFSVTDAEWPAVRAAHLAWLDPGNFDDAGHQLTSLGALVRNHRPAGDS